MSVAAWPLRRLQPDSTGAPTARHHVFGARVLGVSSRVVVGDPLCSRRAGAGSLRTPSAARVATSPGGTALDIAATGGGCRAGDLHTSLVDRQPWRQALFPARQPISRFASREGLAGRAAGGRRPAGASRRASDWRVPGTFRGSGAAVSVQTATRESKYSTSCSGAALAGNQGSAGGALETCSIFKSCPLSSSAIPTRRFKRPSIFFWISFKDGAAKRAHMTK